MMLAQGMGVESATARIRCSENSAAKGSHVQIADAGRVASIGRSELRRLMNELKSLEAVGSPVLCAIAVTLTVLAA